MAELQGKLNKLASETKEYCKNYLLFDLKAGFITAVVALPLAIAFAIASGVEPIMGLYTAIIAGILGSTFGGSRFSITGPTGAMTVVILSTVQKFGVEGLLLTGFLAGIMQLLLGLLKFGRFVKFIPFPVISGFTAGIGVIIFIGQLGNAFGLTLSPKEHIWENIGQVIEHLGQAQQLAVGITIITILCLLFLPKILSRFKATRNIPSSLLPLLFSTAAVMMLALPIPIVGNIPSGLPAIHMISINFQLVKDVLPSAFTIAMLGIIEAMLCAVVCDGMSNTKHKSDKELIGQGVCNIIMPFFNGIPATAAIARSAVNIREGAKTRMAGIIHGLILLIIILLLSPIAKYIPKAFLAGMLMYVSARMINVQEFRTIIKISRSESIVLFATFGLTVLTDLVFAVEVGMVLAIFLVFVRLTKIIDIRPMTEYSSDTSINNIIAANPNLTGAVGVYTLNGPFFFGAMNVFDKKITEQLDVKKMAIILRMKYVPFVDSTGVTRLNEFIKERQKEKSIVFLSGLHPPVKETLEKNEEFRKTFNQNHIFRKTIDALIYVEKNYHILLLEQGRKK